MFLAYFDPPTPWTEIAKRTVHEVGDDNCLGLAAQLAFYFLLSLFPAVLFLVALAGYLPVEQNLSELVAALGAVAPAELVARVPAGAFRPPPSVESAVLRVIPRADPVVPPALEERYRRLVQDAFGLRRKQLRRVVRTVARVDVDRADAILARAELDAELRPESLSPEEFARLLAAIAGVSDRGS